MRYAYPDSNQPKKSAVPIFRRMLAGHQRSLNAAHEHNEPSGQIASRELEIVRINGALQRTEELSDDVAAAIEGFSEGAFFYTLEVSNWARAARCDQS